MSIAAPFPKESDAEGAFVRQQSAFRDRVTADGSSGYPAEAGRYHLYVSWACPWAHRTVIGRRLKGLEDVIGVSAVDPIRDERSWVFTRGEYTDPAYAEQEASRRRERTVAEVRDLTLRAERATWTTPSSRGWRSTSSVRRSNSGSSSRSNTP